MKFYCDKKDLSDSLLNILRAVSSKSSLPVLEGILIKASDNKLKLFSYDLEIGMTTSIPAAVSEPGEIVLNAKIFNEMIKKMPGEKIEISSDEKLTAFIKSGPSEFTFLGITASEFPEMPSLTDGIKIDIPQDTLSSMLRQTLFAISTDDSKPVITGSLFEINDDYFRITSLDGYRLAIRSEKILTDKNLNFIVPGKSLSEINKMLKTDCDSNLTISVGKRHILFEIDGYSIISRLIDGEFMDYRNILNKQFTSEVIVKVKDFIESVDRTSLLISEKLKSPVKCVFEKDIVKISCSTSIGKSYDEIPSILTGNPVEICFNNKYLLDALRAIEDDEINIQLNASLSPMKIYPVEGDSYIFLLLPVRMPSDE